MGQHWGEDGKQNQFRIIKGSALINKPIGNLNFTGPGGVGRDGAQGFGDVAAPEGVEEGGERTLGLLRGGLRKAALTPTPDLPAGPPAAVRPAKKGRSHVTARPCPQQAEAAERRARYGACLLAGAFSAKLERPERVRGSKGWEQILHIQPGKDRLVQKDRIKASAPDTVQP